MVNVAVTSVQPLSVRPVNWARVEKVWAPSIVLARLSQTSPGVCPAGKRTQAETS